MKKALFTLLACLNGTIATAQVAPADQTAFRNAIISAREAYDSAENDLAKGGVRPRRGKAICEAAPARQVKDWYGTVYKLSTNGDGWGVLSIELEGEIWVSTWNNSFSDTMYGTLVDPSSDLFTTLASLKEGQDVIFSGSFFEDDVKGDCYAEQSMTMEGSMSEPEFVFAFSAVSPRP